MGRAKKVVLAYSGGVDTSVCIPYLKQEWGVEEVITLAADLGQGDELEPIREKALKSGASESLVADVKDSFVKDYAFGAIQANALYENRYPLGTALARPLIAKILVETAEKYGADAIAHGCTGKGNDQVRFDVSVTALNPNLKILAPAREWGMSREETIAYGEKFGIPSPVKKSSPYSIDKNLLGRSIEAGLLEDPSFEPPEEIYEMTKAIADTPNEPEYIEIGFNDVKALHDKGVLFLDARRTSVYEHGHIPGARPFSVWESDIDEKVNKLFNERSDPKDQNLPIVVYCSGGDCEDSHMLAQKLWGIQFNNVYVYKDGFPDWAARSEPFHTGPNP